MAILDTPERLQEFHRLFRNNYWQAGGGLSYSVGSFDVFASFTKYVWGTDTHDGQAYTVGATWYFGGAQVTRTRLFAILVRAETGSRPAAQAWEAFMKYRRGVIGLIGIAGLCVGTSLLACGDKFLVAGRGARFQRGGARATVLIYAPLSSVLRGELRDSSCRQRPEPRGLPAPPSPLPRKSSAGSCKESGPGVVLADIADAPTVEKYAPAGSSGPVILPVLNNASRQELAEARKTWGVALKSPASGDSLLDAVDEAVGLRAKAKKNGPP